MTTKRCAYRGCNSFSSSSYPCLETFYAFPKDPERFKQWLKLAGCPEELPYNMKYLCSKHFDESKYVAHNQRRKQLLRTAVPWPYNQSPQKEIVTDEPDYQFVESTIDINEDNDDSKSVTKIERFDDDAVSVELSNDLSTISETIEEALQRYEDNDDEGEKLTITLPSEKRAMKRKLEMLSRQSPPPSEELQPGPSNDSITLNPATSSTIPEANEEVLKEANWVDELDESKLMESSNLTMFIFKGQEYIQMPKDDYISEKLTLMQKIRYYEEVLKNVKNLMDDVNV